MNNDKVAAALEAMAMAISNLADSQTALNQEVAGIRGELAQNAAAIRNGIKRQKEREQAIRNTAAEIRGKT